ncbi:TAXI family TRAP transporter solute-binding subunit [Bradyrhizobium sp.]|uniref:TAXI family TRAP transporter solute-binding subunit n=1 Tax=Bradyrhizobium sp. TaxID=376 RepID=UPI002D30690E|nr:TAXI family TRAP transporter solute-binding subunit [Bradyrhizobium sp.]HZR71629.1 TAXI family TRAP transporter solute-binding subunit [Bradyrhizobium sp.]
MVQRIGGLVGLAGHRSSGGDMSVSDGLKANPASGGRKRSSPFLVIAAGLLIFAAIIGAAFLLWRPATLRIAVGPAGSEDQKLIQTLAQTFISEGSPVRLTVVSTAGPVESLGLLSAGEADLAVGRADEDMPKGTGAVAILRKNVVVLWAPSGAPKKAGAKKDSKSKIKEIADLEGHRVGVLGRTSVNVTLLKVILSESGLNPDKVAISRFSVSQITEMVKDSAIDAFMTVGPLDSKITADAINQTARLRGEPAFLPIDVSEALAHKHPLYEAEEIPGSSFTTSPARPDDTVDTVGVNHLIVAPKSLSDATVGAFTRALFAVRPALIRQDPGGSKIQKPDTDKDAAIPAHAGAAAYIDGTERTFLDKYSDYFWAAILVLSVLGSGAAWVRHYIKRDERSLTSEHRDKLLAHIAQVRKTDSVEELDALQEEADEFLRETLECYDDGAIDEGDLSAYSLVLEQFHHAVADRRAVIAGSPVGTSRIRA